MKKDLLERLEEYCGADYVPLHMPGAKRNTQEFVMPNPHAIDITEIDGFDNMHHAEDILKEAFEQRHYGAAELCILVGMADDVQHAHALLRGQIGNHLPFIMPFT